VKKTATLYVLIQRSAREIREGKAPFEIMAEAWEKTARTYRRPEGYPKRLFDSEIDADRDYPPILDGGRFTTKRKLLDARAAALREGLERAEAELSRAQGDLDEFETWREALDRDTLEPPNADAEELPS
jgi:hypothetical protein